MPAEQPVAMEKSAAPVPEEPKGPLLEVVAASVNNGQTASTILSDWLGTSDIHNLAEACKPVFDLCRIRAGQPYRVHTEDGALTRWEYEIDNDKFLVVDIAADAENGSKSYVPQVHDIHYDMETVSVSGIINSNLFEAVEKTGENAALAITLADIFGWEVDFIRDLRQGDSFSAVVEKRFRDGEFKGYRRVLAASFTNQGTRHEGYRMEDEHGVVQYYNAEGGNLRRAFLKAPLSFTRISSNFSHSRLHPVLKTYRPHHGVDYAAPTGTPVLAIGDGTVTKVASDHAAGKYVMLRHTNGYESGYLHFSSFAKGMKVGKRVRQGEVIGYVGATGYATGPHLDFRMKKNGAYVNPTKVISPRSEPVSKKKMEEFAKLVEAMRLKLDAETVAAGTETVPNNVN
ncbi:peptidase M24 [Desulfovibrio psychrotolerans]|uniref:Peptidase M24 n=1 Tax=Desulfovibrio psychrotolerans TaxID=415242 RepID=A0A7J0BZD7_9BACT|nr:peptidase M24 [Desulfovibrio psychrotolerans]